MDYKPMYMKASNSWEEIKKNLKPTLDHFEVDAWTAYSVK